MFNVASKPEGRVLRPSEVLQRILNTLSAVFLGVMAFAICAQVFGRYVLDDAPGWSEEVAKFLMAWMTMVAAGALVRDDGHISVTVLTDRLPSAVAMLIAALRDMLILGMAMILAYFGFLFAEFGLNSRASATEISMAWAYAAIPAGGLLVAVMLVLKRIEDFRDRREARQ